MFDASGLDSALDSLFGDEPAAPAPAAAPPAAPAGGGLFDSSGLDSALDSLFGEEPAAPAPAAPAGGGMFDSSGLDNALDSLFGDAPAAAPASPPPSGGGMFDSSGLDSALDSLFDDGPAVPAAPAPVAPPASSGLFDVNGLDSALDDLFSNGAASPPPAAPAPVASPIDDALGMGLNNLNFDDLAPAAPVAPPPQATFSADNIGADFMASFKIDDSKSSIPDVNYKPSAPGSKPQKDGLAPMGKMLVDQSTLEDIIRRAEKLGAKGLTTTQVILAAQGQTFDELLKEINEVPGVLGTLIVGNDGLVIANTMPNEIDKEIVGALTSSIYLNLDVQIKRMQRGGLKRLVIETDIGLTVLSTLEMGTLVAFSQNTPDFSLAKLLAAVIAMTGRQ